MAWTAGKELQFQVLDAEWNAKSEAEAAEWPGTPMLDTLAIERWDARMALDPYFDKQ
jgi:hypothetical protein